MKTSEKIKALRIRRGLSQEKLGDLVGVKKAAINKYETGRVVNIKRSTLQRLADALGVLPADLLDDTEYSSPIDLSSFDPSYLSFMKDAQDEGIDTDDIMRAIELVRKARESVKE